MIRNTKAFTFGRYIARWASLKLNRSSPQRASGWREASWLSVQWLTTKYNQNANHNKKVCEWVYIAIYKRTKSGLSSSRRNRNIQGVGARTADNGGARRRELPGAASSCTDPRSRCEWPTRSAMRRSICEPEVRNKEKAVAPISFHFGNGVELANSWLKRKFTRGHSFWYGYDIKVREDSENLFRSVPRSIQGAICVAVQIVWRIKCKRWQWYPRFSPTVQPASISNNSPFKG